MTRPTFSAADHFYMARALQLAARGLETTSPNPRVGCVLVAGQRVVGEGFHVRAGEDHAEITALKQAGPAARGATAYVTLEPCSHHGRTPPCADALIRAGVARVVAAMQDPNPKVAGTGVVRLAQAGIVVDCGLMEDAALELNLGFVSRMTRQRPWVRLKIAASLDGKIALKNGLSQWITGPQARRDAHAWRARSCAILTGLSTVKKDDPSLTVRAVPCERMPLRVVLDSRLETPLTARLFDGLGPVWIFHASNQLDRVDRLTQQGARLIDCANGRGEVDLIRMLALLAQEGINEVLVEAGARLNGALLNADCADELLLYLAPSVLGGEARGLFDSPVLSDLSNRKSLVFKDVRRVGSDLRILARFQPSGSTDSG